MNVNQEVRLNLSADGIPPRLFMPQGDANSRTIIATLWYGAAPYNVPASAAVMVRFRKPDGTGGLYDATEAGTAVTASGNTVTAPVATQMLAVAGVVQAEIDIYGTGSGKAADRLATFRFAVEVVPSVYPDAQIISTDYFNLIAATISEALEAAAKADLAKTAAQAAQSAAEAAQSGAESAEQGAQAAQTAAENAKTAAQSAKTAAENAKTAAQTAQQGAEAAQAAAEGAKSGAQAAQQAAQTARQGAEAAKGAAEDAQAAAASSAAAAAASAANAATSVEGAVKYNTTQTLTDAQKQQARDNINAPAPYEAGDNIAITGRIITTKAFPCNPHLLDNWYFGNPVNQRGKTTYSGVGYGIDRWKAESETPNVVTVNDGYIELSQNALISEILEEPYSLCGKQVTVSALTTTGLYSATATVPSKAELSAITADENIGIKYFAVNGNNTGYVCLQHSKQHETKVLLRAFNGYTVGVIAVKLELGSQQTLAHQENGKWVLNEIPDYGEQLRRCQRYYFKTASAQNSAYMMRKADDNYLFDSCIFPVTMRTTPSIQLELYRNPTTGDVITATGAASQITPDGFCVVRDAGKFTGSSAFQVAFSATADL